MAGTGLFIWERKILPPGQDFWGPDEKMILPGLSAGQPGLAHAGQDFYLGQAEKILPDLWPATARLKMITLGPRNCSKPL